MKRFASRIYARALATIRKGIADLRRALEVPVGRIPEFCIVFSMSLHHRGRPTPTREIILIYQQLKSGTEFDQFGIRGRREDSSCCAADVRQGGDGAASSNG
jgi:hypothetical protein